MYYMLFYISLSAISLANLCSKYINQQCTDDKEGEEKGEELHLLKLLRQLELLENVRTLYIITVHIIHFHVYMYNVQHVICIYIAILCTKPYIKLMM